LAVHLLRLDHHHPVRRSLRIASYALWPPAHIEKPDHGPAP
jgi:hypothetical protein